MSEPSNTELAGLIAQYATERTTRRQLAQLPRFAVPGDSDIVFRDLLSRLDQAAERTGRSEH